VVTVPGGTVQGGFFFLAVDTRALTSKEVQGRVKHYGKVMSRSWMEGVGGRGTGDSRCHQALSVFVFFPNA
jgi:hypothetical protein